MGIYIKGLKAPASCCKCRFGRWWNYGQLYMCDVCEKPVAKFQSEYESTKPDWCPLIEVPEPHGDLIDRNALEKAGRYEVYFFKGRTTKVCFVTDKYLDEFTVVIEREDGEKHEHGIS